jgi:AraC-like DNA-binding protein
MIFFESDHTDFHAWLKDFAKELGTIVEQDSLNIPSQYGSGYMRGVRLPNGLSVAIIDCSMETEISVHKNAKEPIFYTLCFDEVHIKRNFSQVVGTEKATHYPPLFSGAYLNSTLLNNSIIAAKGCRMYAVKVLFDTRWMAKYLGIDKDDDVIKKYLALKTKKFALEPLDGEYRKLVDELISADVKNPLYYTIVENRVMHLMERFFTRFYERAGNIHAYRIDGSDIYRMMEVESNLLNDFTKPAPTIVELSGQFSIGISKLKRQFRQVYGYPIYEYFQKYRMERAKTLLLSGDFSIKEIGYHLGYQNLSNFARAFKKAYNYLPSEVLNFRRKGEVAEMAQ